jgi:hypothetical protein
MHHTSDRTTEFRARDPRVEQRELLIKQVGTGLRINREREAGRRETLKQCLSRDVGDVLEHPAILDLRTQFGRIGATACTGPGATA